MQLSSKERQCNVVDLGFNTINYSYFSIHLLTFLLDYDASPNANPPTAALFQIASFKIVQWAETGQKLGFPYPLSLLVGEIDYFTSFLSLISSYLQ